MENTSATNPNKKKFVESLAAKSYTGPSVVDYLSKSGYDSSLASRNQLATEYGVKDYVPGSAQSNTALMAALRGGNNNVTNPSGTNVPGASDTTTSVSGGTTTPSNPYKQYLQSLFGGDSYKSAFEKYGTDSERLAGIQNEGEAKELEARRLYEETLNRPGGLLGGAQQAAAVQSRLSNQELADLALRESAASRTAGASQSFLQTLLSAGKDLSDLTMEEQKLLQKETPAPFELSPGQARYEYDPESRQYKAIASLPSNPPATNEFTNYTAKEKANQKIAQQELATEMGTAARDVDGFVTPEAYRNMKAKWVGKGFSGSTFDSIFGGYVNPKNQAQYGTQYTTKTSSNDEDAWLEELINSVQ